MLAAFADLGDLVGRPLEITPYEGGIDSDRTDGTPVYACSGRSIPRHGVFPAPHGTVLLGDIEQDEFYYTNSIHLRADADVDILSRIRTQAKFHPLIESGAIIHAFVGEQRPSPESILNLVRKTFEKTQAAQLTISPEFTCRETPLRTLSLS